MNIILWIFSSLTFVLIILMFWLVKKKKTTWSKVWNTANTPLVTAVIVGYFLLFFYLMFGHTEKVDCTFIIRLDKKVMMEEYNWSEENVDASNQIYEEESIDNKFRYNKLFESYQEALAYGNILDEYVKRKAHNAEVISWCENKTLEPPSVRGFVKK